MVTCTTPHLDIVGLHTSVSFSCQCPATIEFKWLFGPKICSFHQNWRTSSYWQDSDEETKSSVMWRLDPPGYYNALKCRREGTRDIAYVCLDSRGQLISGFVKPNCRKAEYCLCKQQYYGASCEKVWKYLTYL